MLKTIDEEASNGFPNLRGSQVSGTIPLSKSLINFLVKDKGITVDEIRSGNTLSVKYRVRFAVEIVRIDLRPLTVVIRVTFDGFFRFVPIAHLAARAIGILEGMFASLRGHLEGANGLIYVKLDSYSEVAAYRSYWQPATEVNVRSDQSALFLDFKAQVK
jgi:hypothetical protein